MRKIVRGTGFRGVMNYIFRHEKTGPPGLYVGGTVMETTLAGISKEFLLTRRLRPDIEKPVWHNSLRLPEGEKISVEKWHAIADDYMSQMGFNELHQWVAVLHDDDEGQHIHIVCCRIDYESKIWLGANENLISTKIISSLERKHCLLITKGVDYKNNGKIIMPDVSELKREEIEKSIKTNRKHIKVILQETISNAMKGSPTTAEFMRKIESHGIKLRPNIASTGTMNGFSFEYGGLAYSGSALGKNYKWSSILKEIDYVKDRDRKELTARIKPITQFGESTPIEIGNTGQQSTPNNYQSFIPFKHGSNRVSYESNGRNDNSDDVPSKFNEIFQCNTLESDIDTGANHSKIRRNSFVGRNQRYADEGNTANNAETGLRLGKSKHRRQTVGESSVGLIDLDRSHKFRCKLLQTIYGEASTMVANYWRINVHTKGRVEFYNKNGRVVDHGRVLECKDGNANEIEAMFELVRLKGWHTLTIYGTDDFRYRAMCKAVRSDISISIKTEQDRTLLDRVKKDLAELAESPAKEKTRDWRESDGSKETSSPSLNDNSLSRLKLGSRF